MTSELERISCPALVDFARDDYAIRADRRMQAVKPVGAPIVRAVMKHVNWREGRRVIVPDLSVVRDRFVVDRPSILGISVSPDLVNR